MFAIEGYNVPLKTNAMQAYKGVIVGQDSIVIKGAREHNLKNVDVTIPRD